MAVYAVSDLHGRYDLWKLIKDFLMPNDTLFVLGDCADRGSEGWKIIKEVLQDKRCIYLKGNHEDMLVKAVKDYLRNDCCADGRVYEILLSNGGYETFRDITNEPEQFIGEWIRCIDKLPEYKSYVNEQGFEILLTHAGFTPPYKMTTDLLWDRTHFIDHWPEGEEFSKTYIIHGHTPIPYTADYVGETRPDEPGVFWYCDKHKCCIDHASAWTSIAVLLNLDTFKEEIFIIDK